MDRTFLPADIHYFRALKLGLLPLCPFSKPFGGIFFFKFVWGGGNILWKRSVYNIEPEKLFVFFKKRFDEESFLCEKL